VIGCSDIMASHYDWLAERTPY